MSYDVVIRPIGRWSLVTARWGAIPSMSSIMGQSTGMRGSLMFVSFCSTVLLF